MTISKGGHFWTPITPLRGQFCMPVHSLLTLRLSDQQYRRLRALALRRLAKTTSAEALTALELRLASLNDREERLTDALIDNLIDKETYLARKQALDVEQNEIRAAMKEATSGDVQRESVMRFLELARGLYLHYEMADPGQKRWIVQNAFSNCTAQGKNLSFATRKWLRDVEDTVDVLCGAPLPVRTRTEEMISALSDAIHARPKGPACTRRHLEKPKLYGVHHSQTELELRRLFRRWPAL
jgi:aminopeptidase N